MPPSKPRLQQAEFDEAVKTNMEDFDMGADEAIKSAVEEFELQGYDLIAIVKSVDGSNTDGHPAAQAAAELRELRASGAAASDPPRAAAAAAALQRALRGGGGGGGGGDRDAAQQALVVAQRAGALGALLALARDLFDALPPASAAAGGDGKGAPDTETALIAALKAARAAMANADARGDFLPAGGAELAQALLRAPAGAAGGPLAAAAAAMAEAASFKEEEGKCRFVEIGFASDLLRMLEHPAASPVACAAAAGALRAFVNADDERSTGSKCFAHARGLAKSAGAVGALLAALRRLGGAEAGAAAAVMAALKQIAANEDICKEAMELGGTGTLLALLRDATDARAAPAAAAAAAASEPADADDGADAGAGAGGAGAAVELARGAAGALRQLANSDAVKSQLAELGALDAIMRALRAFGGEPGVQEEALGLLGALTLRMPEIAAAAADAGAVEALISVLQDQAVGAGTNGGAANGAAKLQQRAGGNGGGGAAAAGVARQACMAVRNMAVRNPELRAPFLERGAEALLRGAKARHAAMCGDVGSAALRDLGLDQYQ
ncbi:MAG: hypothetical protein J3K34DRAFT_524021 [Monoraphidium minutum]|nr:MAG: hypothetical protein J3K34DRAFT_524021 [Monoraphidium minutum]